MRHMRQLPAIDSRSWKQKRGISAPPASQACSSVYSGGTSISLSSTMSLVMSVSCSVSCGSPVRRCASRGLPQLRGRNALPAERAVARTVSRQIFEPLLRFVEGRQMARRNPPHHGMRSFVFTEPFLASAIKALVHGLINETFERFGAFPYRQIDRHLRIGKRPEIGGVAAVVLQTPDKTLAALGEHIDQVEIVHEVGHARIVGRVAEAADIELGKMSGCVHRAHSAATETGSGCGVGVY